MKANAVTVLKLIQGSKVFLIPTFQRRYTWKLDQWKQLWDDLSAEYGFEHPEDSETLYGHFLGSVVLHPALGPASTLMRHQVIDGQQRLTTILILLAALRDVRQQADPEWDPKAIDDQYLTNPFSKDHPARLVPTKLDREAYSQTVHDHEPTGDIGIAYNYFKSAIEKAHESGEIALDRLEDTLLLHMLLVEITTKPGDSVNSIFNTLNSKGMDLSAADLVRNEILHHVGEEAGEAAYDKYWIPMEEALVKPKAKNRDREFVTFLWALEVALNPKTSRDELFSTFEKRFRGELTGLDKSKRSARAQVVLREMYEDHKLFGVVRDAAKGLDDPRITPRLLASLQALQRWQSEPVTPIALWVLKQSVESKIDQDDAAEALNILLTYLVKRILHGIPTNQLNRLLTPVASELAARDENESVAKRMQTVLSKQGYYWPTDEQVRSSVATVPIYASFRRYVKFLLSVVERRLPGMESADLSRSQIEHVMPQILSAEWRSYLSAAGVELTDADALTHTLGNLTLTDNNQKMGNASFAAKKEGFFAISALRLNRGIAQLDDFLPANIRDRSLQLADSILDAFPHQPLPSVSSFTDDGSGASVNERLEALLQTLPVSRWVTEEDLVSVLGASSEEVRAVANALDPTLARLIRDADNKIPKWFSADLNTSIARQDDAQRDPGKRLTAIELSELTAASEDPESETSDDADEFE